MTANHSCFDSYFHMVYWCTIPLVFIHLIEHQQMSLLLPIGIWTSRMFQKTHSLHVNPHISLASLPFVVIVASRHTHIYHTQS